MSVASWWPAANRLFLSLTRGYAFQFSTTIGTAPPQILDFFSAMRMEETKLKVKHEIEWDRKERDSIVRAIDYGQYDIVIAIDEIGFEAKQAAKNISQLLSRISSSRSDAKIIFRELNVFKNASGKKVYRVREVA